MGFWNVWIWNILARLTPWALTDLKMSGNYKPSHGLNETRFFFIFWTVILQNLIRREFCTVFLYQIAQIHYTNDLKQNDVALMILKYEFYSTSDETLFALDVDFIMWWTNVFFVYIYWIEWTDKIVGARKNRLLFRKRTKRIQTALKERNCGKTCNIEIIIH